MKVLAALGLALVVPLACLAAEPPATPAASAPMALSAVRAWERLTGIDTAGWRLLNETPAIPVFQRPDGILMQLDVLGRRADHDPYLYDQRQAQDFFREDALVTHAGLVEVQVHRMQHGTYDLVTTKAKLGDISTSQPGSIANAYTLMAVFPMPQMIGEIRLFAVEGQPTGLREALVSAARAIKDNPAHAAGMPQHDPYDGRFDATARYMDSDAREWDRVAPAHPLTRLRALMPQLMASSKLLDVPQSVAAELAAASAAAGAIGR